LPRRVDESVQQRLTAPDRLFGHCKQRFDRAPRHPARAVLSVGAKLLHPGGEIRHREHLTRNGGH
jgi:hypothetical protein